MLLACRLGYEYDYGSTVQNVCNEFMYREDRDRAEFDDCLCFAMCVEQEPQPAPTTPPASAETEEQDTAQSDATAAPLAEITEAQLTTDTTQVDSIPPLAGTDTDAHTSANTNTNTTVDSTAASTEAIHNRPSPPATS